MEDNHKMTILPVSVKSRILVFWVFILPQFVLFLLNVFSFWIIREDMAASHLYKVFTIAGCEIFLLLIMCVLWMSWKRAGLNSIPWKWNWFFLLMHMAYLWYVSYEIPAVIPAGTEAWILDRGQVILSQYAFMMPALFYSALRLACFETRLTRGADIGRSLLVAVGMPMLWYTAMLGLSTFYRWTWMWFPTAIGMVFFVGSSVITLIALIRLSVLIYSWYQGRDAWTHNTVIALVALVGPLAGLLLNRNIPFPADFQSEIIYGLAVVNGLILLVPSIFRMKYQRVRLFLRAWAYPFTLYFFLVFLPFLPLSLLAICALGLGFLFLIPVLLFLLHTKILIEDYQSCAQQGSRMTAVALILSACLVLPGAFVAETLCDKTAVEQALDYVYASDYEQPQWYPGSARAVERTLIKMRQAKDGAQLPYLSALYNRIVFHGMVLPNSKMEYMFRLFTGKSLNDVYEKSAGWRSRIRGRDGAMSAGRRRRPERDRNVVLFSTTKTSRNEGVSTVTKMVFYFINIGHDNAAEFFRECTLPPGVLITDFRLQLNNELVPGQIFEQKTATWVYHMIRDWTRRDPGLIVYKSPQVFELSIFPFRTRETRYAEIEFTYPRDAAPVIYIGRKGIALRSRDEGPPSPPVPLTGQDASGNNYSLVFPEMLESLAKIKRKPYLHFILDFSLGEDPSQYAQQMMDVAAEFPDIHKGKISAANFEVESLTRDFIDFRNSDLIKQHLQQVRLPSRGALELSRVFKHELTMYQSRLESEDFASWSEYPVFVVLSQKKDNVISPEDMSYFQFLTPENDSYYIKTPDQPAQKHPLFRAVLDPYLPEDVVVFRRGPYVSFAPGPRWERWQWHVLINQGKGKQQPLEVYDPNQKYFVPILYERIPGGSFYGQALGLYVKNYKDILNPSKLKRSLPALVQQSKSLGVLIPATAHIIVERSSQWKTLQLREFQRLHSQQGLEFEEDFETPAPPFWLLAIACFLWLRSRRAGAKHPMIPFPVSDCCSSSTKKAEKE